MRCFVSRRTLREAGHNGHKYFGSKLGWNTLTNLISQIIKKTTTDCYG